MMFYVPLDDVETILFQIWAYEDEPPPYATKTAGIQKQTHGDYERVDDDWFGLGDRSQDDAAQDNQGPGRIFDRTREHLGTSDRGIVLYRRMLRDSIEAVQQGRDPVGVIRDEARTRSSPSTPARAVSTSRSEVRAGARRASSRCASPSRSRRRNRRLQRNDDHAKR